MATIPENADKRISSSAPKIRKIRRSQRRCRNSNTAEERRVFTDVAKAAVCFGKLRSTPWNELSARARNGCRREAAAQDPVFYQRCVLPVYRSGEKYGPRSPCLC